MTDPIDREAAYEVLSDYYHHRTEFQHMALRDALSRVPSAQPEQRWIPCGERLPEYEKEVLVTRHFLSDNELKKNAITESLYVEVASRMDDEWTSYSDEYKIKRHLHKVIAWMPLPEPWRGEEYDIK